MLNVKHSKSFEEQICVKVYTPGMNIYYTWYSILNYLQQTLELFLPLIKYMVDSHMH